MIPRDIETVNWIALGVAALAPLLLARRRPFLAFVALVLLCGVVPIVVGQAAGASHFHRIRLLAHGLFAAFPIGALLLAVLTRRAHRVTATLSCAGALVMLGVYGWAFHVEPERLQVTHHRIESARVDAPVRIALVADLQTDDVGAYEARALAAVRATEPDVILMAGDYLQPSSRRELARQRPLLKRLFNEPPLDAPLGVHAVAGNCEVFGAGNWTPLFEGTRVTTYPETEVVDLGSLTVTCLDFRDGKRGRTVERPDERFHVALSHVPNYALGDVDADLLLAGHCHGGQVRFPFIGPPIILARIDRAWTDGLIELEGGRHLVVSRGIGMERGHAPRMRFLCPPEIVVIDIVPVGG